MAGRKRTPGMCMLTEYTAGGPTTLDDMRVALNRKYDQNLKEAEREAKASAPQGGSSDGEARCKRKLELTNSQTRPNSHRL